MVKTFMIIAFTFFCFQGFSQPGKNALVSNNNDLKKQFDNLKEKSEVIFLKGFYESFGKNAHEEEIRILKSKKLLRAGFPFTTAICFKLQGDSAKFYVPVMFSDEKIDQLRNVKIGAPVVIRARIFKDLRNDTSPSRRFFMIVENYHSE